MVASKRNVRLGRIDRDNPIGRGDRQNGLGESSCPTADFEPVLTWRNGEPVDELARNQTAPTAHIWFISSSAPPNFRCALFHKCFLISGHHCWAASDMVSLP